MRIWHEANFKIKGTSVYDNILRLGYYGIHVDNLGKSICSANAAKTDWMGTLML